MTNPDVTALVARMLSNSELPICPFDYRSPEYWTTPDDKPCKLCGGLPDGPDKCTGADMRVMKEAASALTDLSERLAKAEAQRDDSVYFVKHTAAQLSAAEARAEKAERTLQIYSGDLTTAQLDADREHARAEAAEARAARLVEAMRKAQAAYVELDDEQAAHRMSEILYAALEDKP